MFSYHNIYIGAYLYICTEGKRMSYTIYDMLSELPVEELKDIKEFVEGIMERKIKDTEELEEVEKR
jgi:hypothetical protein